MRNKTKKIDSEILFSQEQPQGVDLEIAVLGAVLLDTSILDDVLKDFKPEIFYDNKNRIIAEAIISMYSKGEKIDMLTLIYKLRSIEKIDEVGGAFYISQLTSRVGSTANLEYHIKILQELSLKRSLIDICGKSIQKAFSNDNDVFDVYAELQTNVDNSLKQVMQYEVMSIGDISFKTLEESREVAKNGNKSGVVSGLKLVDNLTSGWQKSDLIILAGRPSMGKTASAISMVIYPSIEKNIPVAVFSLEMSNAQLCGRIQSNLSGYDVSQIIKKQLTLQDIEYIEGACYKLNNAPMYIDDTPNISLLELKSKARKLVKEKGVQLIVIDYLQLMRSGMNIQNREQEIAEISRGLKGLAKELDIPIIALSQLSRLVESRADKKPMLSDLRESGQIEQDADMVIFTYRPEYYGIQEYELGGNTIDTKGLFLLLVAKHRNGELGEIPLNFIHHLTKLTNHRNWDDDNSDVPSMPTSMTPNRDFESDFIDNNSDNEISLPF